MLQRTFFGALPDGREVERMVLRGDGGFEARIITHGAALAGLDRAGCARGLRRRRARP